MTDTQSLLAAILGAPDPRRPGAVLPPEPDMGIRLVYADWLDDHDQPAQAEFVRVQCAVAQVRSEMVPLHLRAMAAEKAAKGRAVYVRDYSTPEGLEFVAARDRFWALRGQESTLFEAHWQTWTAPLLDALGGGEACWSSEAFVRLLVDEQTALVEWRWGLPWGIRLHGEAWWGAPGRPGWGPKLVRVAPLLKVTIDDRGPAGSAVGTRYWEEEDVRRPNSDPDDPVRDLHWHIPAMVLRGMAGIRSRRTPHYPSEQRVFNTSRAATDALSDACLTFARLPPCKRCGAEGLVDVPSNRVVTAQADCPDCQGYGRKMP